MEKLENCRFIIQKLIGLEFNSVTARVQRIRAELQDKQRSMRQTPVDENFIAQEKDLRLQLNK